MAWLNDDLVLIPEDGPGYLWTDELSKLEKITLSKLLGLCALPQKEQMLGLTIGTKLLQRKVVIWDKANKTIIANIQKEKLSKAMCVAVTPDGNTAVTGHDDNNIRLLRLEDGQSAGIWYGHTHEVTGLSVTPSGS